MSLIEKINTDVEAGEKFLAYNKNFNILWLHYENIPMSEIREAHKYFLNGTDEPILDVVERNGNKVMTLQLSFWKNNFTIFAHSKPLEVQTHYVEKDIIENI